MVDYLIVGAGFYGATCARILTDAGYSCVIVDKRSHIGGNCYDEKVDGIMVHKYGPHIFHTNNEEVWKFVNKYSKFNDFKLRVKAFYSKRYYSMPVNKMTLNQIYGHYQSSIMCKYGLDWQKLDESNFESYLIDKIGELAYNTLFRGYTLKQWNKNPKEIPASIAKRLPIRTDFNDRYFNDKYEGIPINGYTQLISNLLKDVEIRLNYDHLTKNDVEYRNVIYTGAIDEFFGFERGRLEYRSLRFEEVKKEVKSFVGNAFVTYTDIEVPYTRIVEHKYFENSDDVNHTIITYEYPQDYTRDNEPFYPINDEKNDYLYSKYAELAKIRLKNYHFAGRLGSYKYTNMDKTIENAMEFCKNIIKVDGKNK